MLESPLIKLQTWRHGTLVKRDSNAGFFVWNLRNFKNTFSSEHFWWLLLEMERQFIVFPFFITMIYLNALCLNLSWWRSLLYRNQSFDFLCKSMDLFLYNNDSIMKELIDIHILVLLFNLHTESRVLKYKWKTEYAHQKSIQWKIHIIKIYFILEWKKYVW